MDLRPKIAAEIVDALLADLYRLAADGEMNALTDPLANRANWRLRWIHTATSKIVSHSLPMPKDRWVSTDDPTLVRAFIEKYPKTAECIAYVQHALLDVLPNATFQVCLRNDPEGCHVCHEGQGLSVDVDPNLTDIDSAASLDFERVYAVDEALHDRISNAMYAFDSDTRALVSFTFRW